MTSDPCRRLQALIRADPARMRLLHSLQALALPDAWIAAGTVRGAVWDHLHGRRLRPPAGDVDIVWFAPGAGRAADRRLERRLAAAAPRIAWSVKNQARMHLRNGDAPYRDTADAMRHWPETATAVAVRLSGRRLEVLAPCGLDDLFRLVLRPTAGFRRARRAVVCARIRDKKWQSRWPRLRAAWAPAYAAAGRRSRLTSRTTSQ
ncbi:MAG: nucleotidyltransferase family protein [Sneathiellaceae bacterium]